MKRKTMEHFFKPVGSSSNSQPSTKTHASVQAEEQNHPVPNEIPQEAEPRMRSVAYERDPGKRRQIWEYPISQRDKVQRFNINEGPYQPLLTDYPLVGAGKQHRRFRPKPHGRYGSDAFTVKGFKSWKKVCAGEDCAFSTHEGENTNSAHNFAAKCYENLPNPLGHIENVIEKQNKKVVLDARLRLKVSIDVVRWLIFQACAFRGHDESPGSRNQGNFQQMIKLLASYNSEVKEVVLDNAPRNAKYTSPTVQKEILQIFFRKVQTTIRDEIGNSKFCIIVDESRDESKKEQMAIVLRFVDKMRFIKERFLDLVLLRNTTTLTVKESICSVLSDNNLSVQDIRCQGYDGASNMQGEWNGLQALIHRECPYAYYVHCMAHRLQLALIAASREIHDVHLFFQDAIFVINVVGGSPKCNY